MWAADFCTLSISICSAKVILPLQAGTANSRMLHVDVQEISDIGTQVFKSSDYPKFLICPRDKVFGIGSPFHVRSDDEAKKSNFIYYFQIVSVK